MFKVWYSNFRYFSQDEWETFEDAVRHARQGGFQASIYKGDHLVASFCPIAGVRKWRK